MREFLHRPDDVGDPRNARIWQSIDLIRLTGREHDRRFSTRTRPQMGATGAGPAAGPEPEGLTPGV